MIKEEIKGRNNMNIYQIDKLCKTYGEKRLFDNISLTVDSRDKIGIIGVNGAGKTTLLNILAEKDTAENIEIIKASKLAIEYLSQNPEISEEATVIQQIFKGDSKVIKLVGEYEEAVSLLSKTPDDQKLQEKMNQITHEMDIQNGWVVESEAKKILTKLKITEFDKKMKELSGGQRKRVALAGALIRPSDILILDEPTNHIDNDTIDFLEDHLKALKTALIMVTHDRYFLDRVTNTIVELENGNIHRYKGNYSKYLEIKQQRQQDEAKIEQKKQRLYKQELDWIRKGVEARRTKQKARKERFEELEKDIQLSDKDELTIDVATTRLGSKIIEAENIGMSYADKLLFENFTYTLNREDRIGIVGSNGKGKTTLLNILAGKIEPSKGILEFGDTIKIGYYTQENLDMDIELRAIEYIKETAEYVSRKDGSKISASQMMENFLFNSTSQHTYIRKLSGGERRRLYLLKILMESPNVLFLDEPTNDLDIETLSVLEEYINYFDGPVVTVSHDRYFLDKICNKIFSFEDSFEIIYTMGGYQDYLDIKKDTILEKDIKTTKSENTSNINQKSEKNKKGKLSYKEQREYECIDSEIAELENKLHQIETEILLSGSDFIKLQQLTKSQEEIEENIFDKLEKKENYEKILEDI